MAPFGFPRVKEILLPGEPCCHGVRSDGAAKIGEMTEPRVFEICAGAGGLALGLESAGFQHICAVDNDPYACQTLRINRPQWEVLEADVRDLRGEMLLGVDLLAGGVPCPPFSIAGRQLGENDERDLFPEVIRLAAEGKPRALLIENVRGFAAARFDSYREWLVDELDRLGYFSAFRVLDAADFGVPQNRSRAFLVAFDRSCVRGFAWPEPSGSDMTVADAIGDLLGARGWNGVENWRLRARAPAPTLVGGSKKHGGPDLGPTRAKKQWAVLQVDGHGLADVAPGPDAPVTHAPRLTVRMAARLQCFPDDWEFSGGKTAAYRQVGNALPPPLAAAVARQVRAALDGESEGFEHAARQLRLLKA